MTKHSHCLSKISTQCGAIFSPSHFSHREGQNHVRRRLIVNNQPLNQHLCGAMKDAFLIFVTKSQNVTLPSAWKDCWPFCTDILGQGLKGETFLQLLETLLLVWWAHHNIWTLDTLDFMCVFWTLDLCVFFGGHTSWTIYEHLCLFPEGDYFRLSPSGTDGHWREPHPARYGLNTVKFNIFPLPDITVNLVTGSRGDTHTQHTHTHAHTQDFGLTRDGLDTDCFTQCKKSMQEVVHVYSCVCPGTSWPSV